MSIRPDITDLLEWFKMASSTGSHNAISLTNNGPVDFVTGKYGNAGDFDKTIPAFFSRAAPNSGLNIGANSFTITYWFNARSVVEKIAYNTVWKNSYTQSTGGVDTKLALNVGATYFQVAFQLYGGPTGTPGIITVHSIGATLHKVNDLNKWFFIACVHDKDNKTTHIYSDSVGSLQLDASNDYTASGIIPGSPGQTLGIGANSGGGNPFDGLVDEITVWNTNLSLDEISWIKDHTYEDLTTDSLLSSDILTTPQLNDDPILIHTPKKILPYIPSPPSVDTPVYILDPNNLSAIGIIEDFYSLVWTERYNELGEFEWQLPLSYASDPLIVFGNLLYIRSSKRIMIIEDIKPETTEEKSMVMVKGRSAESILIRRIIPYPIHVSGNIETIAYALVAGNFTNALDSSRNISVIKTTFPTPTIDILYEEKIMMQPVLSAIESLCVYGALGYKFELESNKLAFSIYEGVNRSGDQSENSYVIFSDNFDNVISSSFYFSQKEKVNTVLVATKIIDEYGQEEDAGDLARIFLWDETSEPSGMDRFEHLLETEVKRLETPLKEDAPAKAPSAPILGVVGKHLLAANGLEVKPIMGPNYNDPVFVETPLTNDEVGGIIVTRGQEILDKNRLVGLFEGDFDIEGNFKYGVDFYMGDIVQCVLEGRDVSARVVELVRSYAIDGIKTYVAFDFIS